MARVTGLTAHLKRLDNLSPEKVGPAISQALLVTAGDIKVDAQISITANAVSGKGHVPSKPGQAPNNDTGFLADHIEAALTGPFKAEVSSNAPYAADLEYGTSKMAERPYMRPAVIANKDNLQQNLAAALNKAARR